MTRADNSHLLIEAAQRRSTSARRRTLEAIAALTDAGLPVTPTSVARHAGVSRQWVYTFHQGLDAIAAARPKTPTRSSVPHGHQPSNASLQHRLEALTDDNQRLRRRVQELEDRLATLYGQWRLRAEANTDA